MQRHTEVRGPGIKPKPLQRPDKAGSRCRWVVKLDSDKSVDASAQQMVMLMLNKGYRVRRLYNEPYGLDLDMHRCKRLLEFTAVDVSSVTNNNN